MTIPGRGTNREVASTLDVLVRLGQEKGPRLPLANARYDIWKRPSAGTRGRIKVATTSDANVADMQMGDAAAARTGRAPEVLVDRSMDIGLMQASMKPPSPRNQVS